MQQQPLRSPCLLKLTVRYWTERLGAVPVWMNEHSVTRGNAERSPSLQSVVCSVPLLRLLPHHHHHHHMASSCVTLHTKSF